MGVTTFTELKDYIEDKLDDDSTYTAFLDEFIQVCEDRINRNLRVKEMIIRKTAPASTTSRYLAHPDNYISMRRLRLLTSPIRELVQVSPENITKFDTTQKREPFYFTDVDEQIEFECIPDTAYTVEMVYYEKLTALSAGNADNAILLAYPSLYIFGSLAEAFSMAFEEDRAEYYDNKFKEELATINRIERERMNRTVPIVTLQDMPGVTPNRSRSILSL